MPTRADSDGGRGSRATRALDRKSLRLAHVYAQTLLDRIGDRERCDRITEEMDQAWTLMQRSWEFSALYTAGLAGRSALRDLIHRVFDGRCSEEVSAFLALMALRCQGHLVGAVVRRMREILEARGGYVDVAVTTAVPLNEDQQRRVSGSLGQSLQVRPKVRWRVDRGLIGGMVVEVGDRRYDASTASRLKKLTRGLKRRFQRND